MALLYGASKIFIDFKTLLFDTDSFVISYIYEAFKDETTSSFTELVNYIKENWSSYEYIGQVKNSINPLSDFVVDEKESDLCYNEILYSSDIDLDTVFDKLAPTDLGKSLLTLMKDSNVQQLYVYIDTPTPTLCEVVYNFFGKDSRVFIVGGNKDNFLANEEFYCDTYIFEDVNDIHKLMKRGSNKEKIEVLIPEFSFNITENDLSIALYDDEGNLISGTRLSEEYNIDVSTISLPLI